MDCKKKRGWEVFIQNFSGGKYKTLICALHFNIESDNYSPTVIHHSTTTDWNWGDVITQMGCIQKTSYYSFLNSKKDTTHASSSISLRKASSADCTDYNDMMVGSMITN